jgi:homoserine dehydrogenase
MSATIWPETDVSRPEKFSRKRDGGEPRIELESSYSPRTVRVGILGLGQVGQAVARLTPEAGRLRSAGLNLRIVGALVRDIHRPRRCPKPARLTTNPAAFLRGDYDVVIEALGDVEPARTIVSRLLGRRVPVVTANKALIAAHGAELAGLAVRRGTILRYEASALAGVPFLGAFASRPLVSDVDRFAAVVNGTSNFILSALERQGQSFENALAQAQALGLTEPDPSRDLDGRDAADKLTLLASLFGWGAISSDRLDVGGIRDITRGDFEVARTLDATIKPVVCASRTDSSLSAFVGPALVPTRHPLASLAGTLSGIQFSGRYVSDLFFSGPGAGPDITAATILDDVAEAVSVVPSHRPTRRVPPPLTLVSPSTEWFVRARFPGLVPESDAACQFFASVGMSVLNVSDAIGDARWLKLGTATRDGLNQSLASLAHRHRIQCVAIRSL